LQFLQHYSLLVRLVFPHMVPVFRYELVDVGGLMVRFLHFLVITANDSCEWLFFGPNFSAALLYSSIARAFTSFCNSLMPSFLAFLVEPSETPDSAMVTFAAPGIIEVAHIAVVILRNVLGQRLRVFRNLLKIRHTFPSLLIYLRHNPFLAV
jgi:hypothetical protein